MRRALVVVFVAATLAACKWPRRAAAKPTEPDASPVTEVDAGALPDMIETKDLPQGSWESTDGTRFGVSLLPDGLVRIVTEVPSYRNGARVFGQVTHAERDADGAYRLWIDVTKIYAKEVGPFHRYLSDFELFEAEVLGQRVTSPNVDAQKIPQLGGKGAEPPRAYSLKLGATATFCSAAPKCRELTPAKSSSNLSRVRTNGLCKVDEDCVVATDGEQCDPCLCPSKASLKTWPQKPSHEDTSWERATEHLCGKEIARRDDCAPCPELHAVCKNKACVLK